MEHLHCYFGLDQLGYVWLCHLVQPLLDLGRRRVYGDALQRGPRPVPHDEGQACCPCLGAYCRQQQRQPGGQPCRQGCHDREDDGSLDTEDLRGTTAKDAQVVTRGFPNLQNFM